jgi:hypothetical protein
MAVSHIVKMLAVSKPTRLVPEHLLAMLTVDDVSGGNPIVLFSVVFWCQSTTVSHNMTGCFQHTVASGNNILVQNVPLIIPSLKSLVLISNNQSLRKVCSLEPSLGHFHIQGRLLCQKMILTVHAEVFESCTQIELLHLWKYFTFIVVTITSIITFGLLVFRQSMVCMRILYGSHG